MIKTFFKSPDCRWALGCGDCIEMMREIAKKGFKFDCAFADPPYFLSNGGISVQSGRQVCVDKGDWDKSHGAEADAVFTRSWLTALRGILKPSGTVWISGSHHNIFQVANALTELGYKILNVITWQKTNPPPNEWVLDPFAGACTTGIAARLLGRRFFGVDLSADYLSIGARRFGEVETAEFQAKAFHLIADLRNMPPQSVGEEVESSYGESLFFE